jgi:hypothetical protein
MNCPLCERDIVPGSADKHHLIPKLKGGKNGPTVNLHTVCHKKIHSTFSENELARIYNTIDKLLCHPDIQNFVKWVKNKPLDFVDSSRLSNRRKR